jgi:hypothetical protein
MVPHVRLTWQRKNKLADVDRDPLVRQIKNGKNKKAKK